MIRMACPHCQVLGEVPALVLHNGDWPIACHHCHQHYFAPVVSGPEPLSQIKRIRCKSCKTTAEVGADKYSALLESKAELFCPDCHSPLPLPDRQPIEKTAKKEILNLTSSDHNSTSEKDSPAMLPGWRSAIFLIFVGFALTALTILAAQEGLIDRTWLDNLWLGLPEKELLFSKIKSILA